MTDHRVVTQDRVVGLQQVMHTQRHQTGCTQEQAPSHAIDQQQKQAQQQHQDATCQRGVAQRKDGLESVQHHETPGDLTITDWDGDWGWPGLRVFSKTVAA